MKSKLALLALLLSLTCAGRASAAEKWKEFKSEGGRFSVLLPGQPKEEAQTKATTGGEVQTHRLNLDLGHVAYAIAYTDLPADRVAAVTPNVILDGIRDDNAKKGVLRSNKTITLDGNPGRELVTEDAKDVITRMRVYMVKNRLYQIVVTSEKKTDSPDDVKKMLDSFKLTGK